MIKLFIKNTKINDLNWPIIKCKIDFNSDLYKKAVKQAKLKSAQTMNASQSGSYRSPEMKFNMQLMGIIAEIACVEYLKVVISKANLSHEWSVLRYDDVRTDNFKSPINEYDIKISSKKGNAKKDFYIESRSSITYNRSLAKGLESFDIIGPYSSVAKGSESKNDFYLRPLYEYKDFLNKDYSKLKFNKYLIEEKITLYIVSGCTFLDLKEKGFKKSMSQQGSEYLVLPIKKSTNIIDFKSVINKSLKSV